MVQTHPSSCLNRLAVSGWGRSDQGWRLALGEKNREAGIYLEEILKVKSK
jgi:hypothetical protein